MGSNLVHRLLHLQVQNITVVDNLLSSEKKNIPENDKVQFIEGSIADDNILAKLEDDFDYIFHLATFHGNQNSIYAPLLDHENNTLTTLKLMNQVKDFKNLKKIVYSGAGCAVAEKGVVDKARPTTEDQSVSLEMDSPYSISKIIGEFYAVYFCRQFDLPVVRARFQNVYGPREILGAGKWRGTAATVWRNVVPVFIYNALKGRSLPVENNGISTRDFIYVEDIVQGLISCALKGESGDVYNIATGKETSILELANTINKLTNNPAPIEFLPKRVWDNSIKRLGSAEKSKEKLGFVAEIGINEGLKHTIQWAKENLEFIDRTIAKHSKYL